MEKTLSNILSLIGTKKGAQRRFTEALGLCPSAVGDWKSGKSKSYARRLPQIAEYFGISADVDSSEDYFYLRVKGDSMIGAGITDGSLVLIRRQSYAEDGQIVACLVDGDYATLKRYRTRDKTILLLPENPSYQPFILSASDFENGSAAILGVAIDRIKKNS